MYKNSVYNSMLKSQSSILNNGYDYRTNGIIMRLVSSRMPQNPIMLGFLKQMDPYFIELVDAFKYLQIYKNYTIDKNDGTINK